MVHYRKALSFLDLPQELREMVYENVFSSPNTGPNLLQACSEIRAEANKFLYQRPLNFPSQDCLLEWLRQARHDLFGHVVDISLSISDIDLSSILNPDPLCDESNAPLRLRTWDLYEAELDKLNTAFAKLSKVKTITIRADPTHQSFLYRDFLSKVLDVLASVYPGLKDLKLEGNFHQQDLAFLSKIKSLQSFTFDGFASSSPTNTAKILSELDCLTNLSLVSQQSMLRPDAYRLSDFTSKPQSVNGDVIHTIQQLASFSVTERMQIISPTLFFTSEVLASLHDHKSLHSFSVSTSYTPDVDVLFALEHFLAHSSIIRLELDWPGLKPIVLENHQLLTETLQVLWVRAATATDALDLTSAIAKKRSAGELQELRSLVLVRDKRWGQNLQTTNDEACEELRGGPSKTSLDVSVFPRHVCLLSTK